MPYTRLEEKRCNSRVIVYTFICLTCIACIPILVRITMDYILLIPGTFGFEWTERYGSTATCNETEFLLTRMRHLGSTKYVPVLRQSNHTTSYVLWNHTSVAYNPTLACLNDTLYIVGSPNTELHLTTTGRVQNTSIYMMPREASVFEPYLLNLPVDSCIEHYFDHCKLDSKFSLAHLNETLHLYIRANMNAGGGSRHVQHTQSHDGGITWTNFQAIQLHNYTLDKNNNIYLFDATVKNDTLVARFPAVFGEDGGIYQSASEDGLHWSQPKLIRSAQSYGERTTLHPIGDKYAMRINLLFRTRDVEIFNLNNGELEHNSLFDTILMK
jgi:hypothetical protein